MMDPVRELKVRAEILQTQLASGHADALARLRVLPEMRRADLSRLTVMAHAAQRKHCLAVVAGECGFANWQHARRVLDGDPNERDFGTLLYGDGMSAFLHPWFARYEEARAFFDGDPCREGERSYLLAYRRDFFVARRDFIEALGFDPDDADWQAVAWDWARPRDRAARRRLYQKRLTALRNGR